MLNRLFVGLPACRALIEWPVFIKMVSASTFLKSFSQFDVPATNKAKLKVFGDLRAVISLLFYEFLQAF